MQLVDPISELSRIFALSVEEFNTAPGCLLKLNQSSRCFIFAELSTNRNPNWTSELNEWNLVRVHADTDRWAMTCYWRMEVNWLQRATSGHCNFTWHTQLEFYRWHAIKLGQFKYGYLLLTLVITNSVWTCKLYHMTQLKHLKYVSRFLWLFVPSIQLQL